jgi:anti-sigma factor RsiW
MARVEHILETDIAMFASGDMPLWRRPAARLHIARCSECRSRAASYRRDREAIRQIAGEMPEGVSWDRLAEEMTANIRVGLEAGECVAPRRPVRTIPAGWRMAGVMAGFSALLVSAWWVNMPPSETAALGGAMKKIARAMPWRAGVSLEDRGPLVEVSAAGIQLRENGGVLGMSQGPARPVSVTLSVQGSARARYVDSETGQVTITGVYAQ